MINKYATWQEASIPYKKMPIMLSIGVIGSNGNIWHINRRFSLRQLRDQGMGKSSLVSAVQNQANKLIEALKGQANRPERIPRDLRVAVINIIWHMVASK